MASQWKRQKSPGALPGHKENRGKLPGLFQFISFSFAGAVSFGIWRDPYCFSVFIAPIMAADRKEAGRAGMLAAPLDSWAAAAMVK